MKSETGERCQLNRCFGSRTLILLDELIGIALSIGKTTKDLYFCVSEQNDINED